MPTVKQVELTLRNPSPHPRDGFVVRSWDPVAKLLGNPKSARVYREQEPGDPRTTLVPLQAQVDVLDPGDETHTQLVFALDGPIPGGDDQYSEPSSGVRVEPAADNEAPSGATIDVYFTGAKLRNEYFELWLNTAKKRDEGLPQELFGGAVTYVFLQKHEGLDILDAPAAAVSWDRQPEQRAMQIDRVHLVRPPWDERGSVDAYPFRDHWRIVSSTAGPVRVTVTIASSRFEFRCKDPGGEELILQCAVYRTLSLYAGKEWIGEEIWLKGIDQKGRTQRLWFSPSYFMMAEFTSDAIVFRYPDHPGWFTINSPHDPRQGYAFATDSRAEAIWNPPLDYVGHRMNHRAYSWNLGATRTAHSFHAFRRDTSPEDLTHFAGLLWYDLAFKRIRATLGSEK